MSQDRTFLATNFHASFSPTDERFQLMQHFSIVKSVGTFHPVGSIEPDAIILVAAQAALGLCAFALKSY
jgi:hypothetical protein